MQIEVYKLAVNGENFTIAFEAVCNSFSSLLWDVEYYQCGAFEIYITANPRNIKIFQTERIVGNFGKCRSEQGYSLKAERI